MLYSTGLHHNIVRWLCAYLKVYFARCRFGNFTSKLRRLWYDVPQGSVIVVQLFIAYVANFSSTAELTHHMRMISQSSSSVCAAAAAVSAHANVVASWADDKNFSVDKTHLTLFASDNHQLRMDPSITFRTHLSVQKDFLNFWISSWTLIPPWTSIANKLRFEHSPDSEFLRHWLILTGIILETRVVTFKALINLLINYVASIFSKCLRHISRLQVVQNAALRIVTGRYRTASIDYLHRETKVTPVRRS